MRRAELETLKNTAQESLDTLAAIADAAGERLRPKGLKPSDLANPNQMASPNVMADMQNRNRERTSNLQELRRKPAIPVRRFQSAVDLMGQSLGRGPRFCQW
jgi:hypothetical protein